MNIYPIIKTAETESDEINFASDPNLTEVGNLEIGDRILFNDSKYYEIINYEINEIGIMKFEFKYIGNRYNIDFASYCIKK